MCPGSVCRSKLHLPLHTVTLHTADIAVITPSNMEEFATAHLWGPSGPSRAAAGV